MIYLILFLLYAVVLSVALWRNGVRSPSKIAVEKSAIQPQNILIIGATGGTGRQLVAQALERGFSVTVLVRNTAKMDIEHPQLKILQGNVLDSATVDAAVQGQDAVVSALGHKQFFRPTRILSEGTRTILQAMEKHNVKRFVCETSLGIGSSAGRMGLYYTFFTIPVILPFYFWDKTRQEKLIAESAADWVIVRPGVLTNRKKRIKIRHGADIGNFITTVNISRADVAAFMLDQLTDDSNIGAAVGICW